MRHDEEAPPPAEQGAILTPPPVGKPSDKAPRTAVEDSAASFIESVRKVFAPCVGVVDAASILMGNCRFSKDSFDTGEGGMANRLKTGAMQKSVQKRQGETLEIPANGGFDDDVSAISAHTLEEMERSRQAKRNSRMQLLTPTNTGSTSRRPKVTHHRSRPPGTARSDFKTSGGAITNHQLWTMPQPHLEEECSVGVSTSGSSSAEDDPPRISARDYKWNGRKSLNMARRAA
ncbi:hypothetical protein IV203_001921 [Nitzschia inconspicua]|uniref:Uncharacterized protein n=1 Tax=Nitzschia inconspicua TaxID=303405 RepID=A0A9K3L896_9STRA|nr:hypothetical protein IV203_001921 [Nitzschia inconspicua]